MATVREVYTFLDQKAPFIIQSDFDNSGFLVGRGEAEVTRLLVALDITEEVVAEAAEKGVQLIVSHHPIIFHPAKTITDSTPTGRLLLNLIEQGIAAICAHTNLDRISGGVNDALALSIGLHKVKQLHSEGIDRNGAHYGIGRIGLLETPCSLIEYAQRVKDVLSANGIRYVDSGASVCKVAVGGGACGDMLGEVAALGCDTFVTADVKYNTFLDAKAMGLNLIDSGHFPTENVICPVLADWLREGFPGIKIMQSCKHSEVFRYL